MSGDPAAASGPLRMVHVGLGGWGANWCRTILPPLVAAGQVEVVAAVDVDPDRHGIAREALGLSRDRCYTDVREALARHVTDFVTVVVTPAHHEQVIEAAVDAGVHILCEKPIADTMAASCRIHRRVTAAGLKLAVTMSHRFDQDKQSLVDAVTSGAYGRLNYVVHRFTMNSRRFGDWGQFRHRIADPLLIEGAVHHFDILRAICGADARTVYARTWNPPWGEYAGDSTALAILDMVNGTRCLYEGAKANASTLNGWTNDYLRAEAEHGTLELDRRRLWLLRGAKAQPPQRVELPLRADRGTWRNAWIVEQFCDWLRGGPPPPTNLADNLHSAALLFAAVESAHTGRPVDVPAFLAGHLAGTASDPPASPELPTPRRRS